MKKRDIVVIGTSAGGVHALNQLIEHLPKYIDVSFFVVLHLAPFAHSSLPDILNRHSHYKALHPRDGEKIKPKHIYIAPPDYHLLIEDGHVMVKKGPKENRFRPSIDALFRSAAYSCGNRVIGIVLTGMLNDGTSGMWAIKRLGGVTIVQDPEEALYPSMPQNVLEEVEVDHIVSLDKIGDLLSQLTAAPLHDQPQISSAEIKRMESEVNIAAQKNSFDMNIIETGTPSPLTCPECNGALTEIKENGIRRYRCHTGHAFTSSTLLEGVTTCIEEDLWRVIRGMEEAIMILEATAKNYTDTGKPDNAKTFLQEAESIRKRAKVIRENVFNNEVLSEDENG